MKQFFIEYGEMILGSIWFVLFTIFVFVAIISGTPQSFEVAMLVGFCGVAVILIAGMLADALEDNNK